MKLKVNCNFFNIKTVDFGRSLNNRSGQAMIEYILLLIISVTLLFVAKSLFSNLNTYMTQYMGGYFKCLMVYGELPQLGVSDKDLKKSSGKCSVKFNNENTASSLQGSGKSIGSFTSSTNKNLGSTQKTASSRAGAQSNSKSSSNKNKSKRTVVDSSDSDDSSSYSSSLRKSTDTYSSADSEAEGETIRSTPLNQNSNNSKSRNISKNLEEDLKKRQTLGIEERTRKGPRAVAQIDEDLGPGPQQRKFRFPQSKTELNLDEEMIEETGFGYYLKWLIIAGIGIAVFILLGGQIMNYRNSDGG